MSQHLTVKAAIRSFSQRTVSAMVNQAPQRPLCSSEVRTQLPSDKSDEEIYVVVLNPRINRGALDVEVELVETNGGRLQDPIINRLCRKTMVVCSVVEAQNKIREGGNGEQILRELVASTAVDTVEELKKEALRIVPLLAQKRDQEFVEKIEASLQDPKNLPTK